MGLWLEDLMGVCPVTGQLTSIALTAFVDDLAQKIVGKDEAELVANVARENVLVGEGFGGAGIKQNIDKQENVFLLRGTYSWTWR